MNLDLLAWDYRPLPSIPMPGFTEVSLGPWANTLRTTWKEVHNSQASLEFLACLNALGSQGSMLACPTPQTCSRAPQLPSGIKNKLPSSVFSLYFLTKHGFPCQAFLPVLPMICTPHPSPPSLLTEVRCQCQLGQGFWETEVVTDREVAYHQERDSSRLWSLCARSTESKTG